MNTGGASRARPVFIEFRGSPLRGAPDHNFFGASRRMTDHRGASFEDLLRKPPQDDGDFDAITISNGPALAAGARGFGLLAFAIPPAAAAGRAGRLAQQEQQRRGEEDDDHHQLEIVDIGDHRRLAGRPRR